MTGKLDNTRLVENMNVAIYVYIDRLNGTKCGGEEIKYFKGPNSDVYQEKGELLRIFLKGSQAKRNLLKIEYPEAYKEMEVIWNIKLNHTANNVPSRYVFQLLCCYNSSAHPICQTGKPDNEDVWYTGRPPL